MPTVYTHNGKAYLRNGVPVLGDCCCPAGCVGLEFYYRFVDDDGRIVTPPSNIQGATGSHSITVNALDTQTIVAATSELWDAANWSTDANWTSLGCEELSPQTCNWAKRNGQARIDMNLCRFQRIYIMASDSRTFTSPAWGVFPKVYTRVYLRVTGLRGSQKIRLYYDVQEPPTYADLDHDANYILDTVEKTNSTTTTTRRWIELR